MTVSVDPQLTLLLEIQDLRSKIRELQAGSDLLELEQAHFNIEPAEAAAKLRAKTDDLVHRLDHRVARRYRQVADTLDRVVVPVVDGTCYGCFVSVSTASAGEEEPNAHLSSCEHCGRFLYFLA